MASVRGATLLGPDKLEVREYPMPDIPADGGLIKIEMGGVCGTDVKYLHGKLKVDYPIILGHEILAASKNSVRTPRQFTMSKKATVSYSRALSAAAAAPTAGAITSAFAGSAPTMADGPSAI